MKKETKSSTLKAKKLCLGEGENVSAVTGEMHKHILVSDKDIEYAADSDGISFMLKSMGVLTHDEHDRMVFQKGKYRSYNQVEFNPLDQTVSRVFD